MKNKLDSLEVTKEVNGTILFNATGREHDDILSLRDKRRLLFDLRVATYDKSRPNRLDLFPYRKTVNVNWGKYGRFMADFKGYPNDTRNAVVKFVQTVRACLKEGNLLEHFSLKELNDPTIPSKNFETIIELIFQQSDDSIVVREIGQEHKAVRITLKDYKENKEIMNNYSKAKQFMNIVKDVSPSGTSKIRSIPLPIFFKTHKFIEFDKGQALISIDLDTSSENKETIANRILNRFISMLYIDGKEVVSLTHSKQYTILNVLCSNEEVEGVLEKFSESFNYFHVPLLTSDFYTYIDVQYNVGQEDETINYYVLLSGSHYKPLVEKLELTGETYLGFKVCK